MTRARIVLLVLAASLAACVRSVPPQASSLDSARSSVALAELQQGRKLLVRKCGSCHQTPLPKAHTAAEWPSKLDEMSARASLDTYQRHMIQQYLVVMAEAPPAKR